MEWRYALEGGGSLTVEEAGLRAVLTAERPEDGRGLYKAYLRGPSGRALLGTLAPEGGRLRIRRTLTLDDLKRQGAWPPVGGEAELAFSFGRDRAPAGWRWTDPAGLRFGEEALQAMAVRQGRVLLCSEGEGFLLACPFSCAQPFPMPALFCLAEPVLLEGERYVRFHFDRDGWPVPPGRGGGAAVC